MKKLVRVLLLLSPLILFSIAFWEHNRWEPPRNPNVPQSVAISTLYKHNESYQAPIELITFGTVYNKSTDTIYLEGTGDIFLLVNTTQVNTSAVKVGKTLYLRGYSYIHDPTKGYFLAIEIHIHTSYSLILSIPVAVIGVFILFWGFKFNLKDFSFSRRPREVKENA
ncbi:MAG: hypothetical protein ACTSRC_20105 [Candidatus Helarchaeota archaeon]